MTATLVWQIAPKSHYKNLPFELRCVLEKNYTFPVIMGLCELDYLRGLRDCDIEGAQELIELITEYEKIELNIIC